MWSGVDVKNEQAERGGVENERAKNGVYVDNI